MRIVIAGGHGKIALLLGARLAGEGHDVLGLIRNPDHAAELERLGLAPVPADLEARASDAAARLADAVTGADAVVFAAGAGAGSGAERKLTVDRDGAIRLIDACHQTGVRRYLMVSAMGARPDAERGEGVFAVYLEAKAQADVALAASGLDYTIVRPGGLTDDPGTGHVALAPELPRGTIARADVAAVLAAALTTPATIGRAFDLTGGSTPIDAALATFA